MDTFFFLLMGVSLTLAAAAPHYPLVRVFVAHPYLGYDYSQLRPAAVLTPQTRRPAPLNTIVHNSISYRVDPEAQPDDALEIAQFHSQDAAGRVVFGFNTPDQTRMEARALDGSVRGSYSYQDPTGKIVKMHYWDDGMGFHTVGNNLPAAYYSAPQYTPEVQAAREHHFQLYRQALAAAMATGGSEYYEEPHSEDSNVDLSAAAPTDISADPLPDFQQPEAPVDDQIAEDSKSPEADYDADSDAVEIDNPDFSFKTGAAASPQHPDSSHKTAPPQHPDFSHKTASPQHLDSSHKTASPQHPDSSHKTTSPQHPDSSHKTAAAAAHSQDSGKTAALTKPKTTDLSSKTPAVPAPPRRGDEAEANRKQLAQPQLNLGLDPSALALARTGTDGFQYLVPVGAPIPGQSESFQATLYGAIPVDAVHDMQVSPSQRENIEDYQRKPLLLRTGLTRTF